MGKTHEIHQFTSQATLPYDFSQWGTARRVRGRRGMIVGVNQVKGMISIEECGKARSIGAKSVNYHLSRRKYADFDSQWVDFGKKVAIAKI